MTSHFKQNLFKNPFVLSIASLIMFSITGCDYPDSLLGDRSAIDVTSEMPFSTSVPVVDPGVEAFQVSVAEGSIASDLAANTNGVSFPANSITPDTPEVLFPDESAPNSGIETQQTPEPSGVLGLLALGLGSVIQREISR